MSEDGIPPFLPARTAHLTGAPALPAAPLGALSRRQPPTADRPPLAQHANPQIAHPAPGVLQFGLESGSPAFGAASSPSQAQLVPDSDHAAPRSSPAVAPACSPARLQAASAVHAFHQSFSRSLFVKQSIPKIGFERSPPTVSPFAQTVDSHQPE